MTRPDPITHGLWFGLVAVMCLFPLLSIPLGYAFGVPKGIGWTGNLALITTFFFAISIRGFSKVSAPKSARWLMLFMFAFIAYAVIGLAFGPNNFIVSGAAILGILGGYGAGFGAYTLARTGSDPLSRTWFWSVLGALPLIVLPFLVAATLDRYTSREWMHKLYGFSNPRSLGHYSTIAVVVLIGLTSLVLPRGWHTPSRRNLALHFAGLVVMWSILMWSGSRGGVAAIAGGMLVSCLALWRLKIAELAYNTAALAAGSALSLLYVVPHGSYSVLGRFTESRDRIEAGAEAIHGDTVATVATEVGNGRMEIWTWAVERIMEKPLFGWSYLPMRKMDPETTPPVAHAHNIVLDYGMGFGIPVAALVLGIVFFLWLKAAKATRAQPSAPHLAAFYIATMLPIYSLVSAVLISPYQLTLFGICLGGLIGAEAWRQCVVAGDIPAPSKDEGTTPEPDGVASDAIFLDSSL